MEGMLPSALSFVFFTPSHNNNNKKKNQELLQKIKESFFFHQLLLLLIHIQPSPAIDVQTAPSSNYKSITDSGKIPEKQHSYNINCM